MKRNRDTNNDPISSWRLEPEVSFSDWTIRVIPDDSENEADNEDGDKDSDDSQDEWKNSIETREYHVHRCHLATGSWISEYFETMFSTAMSMGEHNSNTTEFVLPKAACSVFPRVLDYLYEQTPSMIAEYHYEPYDVFNVRVSNAGNTDVNGLYTRDGQWEGVTKYSKHGQFKGNTCKYSLLKCSVSNNTEHWYISVVPAGKEPGTVQDIDFYSAQVTAEYESMPPPTGWNKCNEGINPPPTIGLVKDNSVDMQSFDPSVDKHLTLAIGNDKRACQEEVALVHLADYLAIPKLQAVAKSRIEYLLRSGNVYIVACEATFYKIDWIIDECVEIMTMDIDYHRNGFDNVDDEMENIRLDKFMELLPKDKLFDLCKISLEELSENKQRRRLGGFSQG